MKITKLVILFNKSKLILGFAVSLALFIASYFIENQTISFVLKIFSALILVNIVASLVASYLLYDKSDLYNLGAVKQRINFNEIKNLVIVHASFDPISTKLESDFTDVNVSVCDIYGNRHEHEKGIETSKKIFPPNPKEIIIHPDNLPFLDNSQDAILAITAVHEILDHQKRVEFFREAKRILKDGGTIIIAEQFRNFTNFLFFNIGAFHFLSFKNWQKATQEAGLEIVENKQITIFANMLVVKKK